MSNSQGYLLDTHIFLWSLDEIERLTSVVAKLLKDPQERVFVSVATAWEISIKHKRGKLPLKTTLAECFRKSTFEILEIKLPHILQLENLPVYHHDPFDRMLVAQATCEKLTIITKDEKIKKYDVSVLPNSEN